MSKKITLLFLVFAFFFLVVVGKAFYIQLINRSKLIAYSQSQVIKTEKIQPNRANIYDRNGQPLAINVAAYNLFIMPQNVQMTADGIKKLVKIIPKLNYKKIRKKVLTRKRFTWIARKVRLTDKAIVELKKIKGLNLDQTVKRYYPNNELLAQTLGFVGIDNKGGAGLEYSLDKKLSGSEKTIKYYKDAKGRPIKQEINEFSQKAKSQDVYLSIEKDVQIILEESLKEAVVKHKADLGGAAVLDADTGEILAVANYPTFNPNNYGLSEPKRWKLSFVTDPIEPGSTLKLLTVASALSNGTVQPDSVFYCEKGNYSIGKHKIREADTNKKYEWLSVTDIIKYSSNIGTTKIAFDLGFPNLRETLLSFNIGNKTGIELPAESRGIFAKKDKVSRIKLSNVSFGQGIATTGIQLISAYGAIANGGDYIKPTILKKETKPEGKKILSSKVVSQLKDMLIKAVVDGTGKKAQIKNFEIGGKTSTAQRVAPGGGYEGYVPGFVGVTYNTDKRYVVLVYVDNPTENGYYGNSVAAPVFKKITEFLLFKNSEKQYEKKSNSRIPSLTEAKKKTSKGKYFSVKKGFVPNFTGQDRSSIEDFSNKYDIDIEIEGFGLVIDQFPKAGTKLKDNAKLSVRLSPPVYD